jgi:hypothetical protein
MMEVQHKAVKHHYIDLSMEETLQLSGFMSKCPSCIEASSFDADSALGEQLQLAHFGLSAVT